jgi:four helix bundle protein
MSEVRSFRDLRVYQELKQLHLVVHEESMGFPKFEMYELGSQVRRSSNSAPANIAEGWASRHTNIYMETINRALGEIQETQHHLSVANDKRYITDARFQELDARYAGCCRMLEKLHQSLSEWRGSTRTTVREDKTPYVAHSAPQDLDDCLPNDIWADTPSSVPFTPETHNP